MQQATLSTEELISGKKRKLAWFKLQPNGLYFEVGHPIDGSHISYHADGNVFRKSPATIKKARFNAKLLPIDKFRGWHQFGAVMVDKGVISENDPLKQRDQGLEKKVKFISINKFPADCLNIFSEIVHKRDLNLMKHSRPNPPKNAIEVRFLMKQLVILLTVIGHEDQLIIRPNADGFTINDFNDRFSANRKGSTYEFEAYE